MPCHQSIEEWEESLRETNRRLAAPRAEAEAQARDALVADAERLAGEAAAGRQAVAGRLAERADMLYRRALALEPGAQGFPDRADRIDQGLRRLADSFGLPVGVRADAPAAAPRRLPGGPSHRQQLALYRRRPAALAVRADPDDIVDSFLDGTAPQSQFHRRFAEQSRLAAAQVLVTPGISEPPHADGLEATVEPDLLVWVAGSDDERDQEVLVAPEGGTPPYALRWTIPRDLPLRVAAINGLATAFECGQLADGELLRGSVDCILTDSMGDRLHFGLPVVLVGRSAGDDADPLLLHAEAVPPMAIFDGDGQADAVRIDVTGGVPPYAFAWDWPDGLAIKAADPAARETTFFLDGLEPGETLRTTLSCTIGDSAGAKIGLEVPAVFVGGAEGPSLLSVSLSEDALHAEGEGERVASDPVRADVANASGDVVFSWKRIEGDGQAENPDHFETRFFADGLDEGEERKGSFVCTVTDRSASVESGFVTVVFRRLVDEAPGRGLLVDPDRITVHFRAGFHSLPFTLTLTDGSPVEAVALADDQDGIALEELEDGSFRFQLRAEHEPESERSVRLTVTFPDGSIEEHALLLDIVDEGADGPVPHGEAEGPEQIMIDAGLDVAAPGMRIVPVLLRRLGLLSRDAIIDLANERRLGGGRMLSRHVALHDALSEAATREEKRDLPDADALKPLFRRS